MNNTLRIATRKSALALWQARTVSELLQTMNIKTTLFPLVTTGDKLQQICLANVRLSQVMQHHISTGKGLFIKEVQESILSGQAHFAVHSMKDLPVSQTQGLKLVTTLPRGTPSDLLILSPQVCREISLDDKKNLQELSFCDLKRRLFKSQTFCEGDIGTTSARRQMLIRSVFSPCLKVRVLRGNVDSRLKKVERNEFSALLLAAAGIERLSLFSSNSMFYLPTEFFIPAAAQGVIGVETNEQYTHLFDSVALLGCVKTAISTGLERLILFLLGGDCHTAIGVYLDDGKRIYVICEQDSEIKKMIIPISPQQYADILNFFKGYKFIYSDFFMALCQSSFARTIALILVDNGFKVVFDFTK